MANDNFSESFSRYLKGEFNLNPDRLREMRNEIDSAGLEHFFSFIDGTTHAISNSSTEYTYIRLICSLKNRLARERLHMVSGTIGSSFFRRVGKIDLSYICEIYSHPGILQIMQEQEDGVSVLGKVSIFTATEGKNSTIASSGVMQTRPVLYVGNLSQGDAKIIDTWIDDQRRFSLLTGPKNAQLKIPISEKRYTALLESIA